MSSEYTPPPPGPGDAPGGKTSVGMEANLASMLCYLTMICCGLGIILSLVFFIIEKENRLLRFHSMQGLLFGGVWIVIGIGFWLLNFILGIAFGDLLGFVAYWGLLVVRLLVGFVLLIFVILAAVKSYQGQYYQMPIIGNIAWNIVNK
jgi:uncharacterized membrane protein